MHLVLRIVFLYVSDEDEELIQTEMIAHLEHQLNDNPLDGANAVSNTIPIPGRGIQNYIINVYTK